MYPLTCVSGYWNVKNKHDEKYFKWFENTLNINCPYVFFSNKEGIELIKKYRKDYPTHYIELDIEDFICYKYKDRILTDNRHCPSVELNLIWNEKIFLIEKAYKLNIFKSDYYMWIDAGVCLYRNIKPPTRIYPNIDKLRKLPIDKFIFSSSNHKIFNKKKFLESNHNHFISGTSFMYHKNIINIISELFKKYLEKINKESIYTDQVLYTYMYMDNPDLFYQLSHGYGENVKYLY